MENNNNRNRWQQRAEHNTKGIRIKVCTPLRYQVQGRTNTTTTKLLPIRYQQ